MHGPGSVIVDACSGISDNADDARVITELNWLLCYSNVLVDNADPNSASCVTVLSNLANRSCVSPSNSRNGGILSGLAATYLGRLPNWPS